MSANNEVLEKILKALSPTEVEESKRRRQITKALESERSKVIHVTFTPEVKKILLEEFRKRKNYKSFSGMIRKIIIEWDAMRKALGDANVIATFNNRLDVLIRKLEEVDKKLDQITRYLKELTEEKEVVEVTATAR